MNAVLNDEGMTLEQSWERMRLTALKVKAERDQMRESLQDIIHGADIMLQPSIGSMPNWVRGYIEEVRRVAKEGLS